MKHRGVSSTSITPFGLALIGVSLSLLVSGCSSDGPPNARGFAAASEATATDAEPTIDGLRLNELQYIGTHNSYHVAPEQKLFEAEKAAVALFGEEAKALGNIDSLSYTHDPLSDQLDQGIRAFELDVMADPVGGLYANPLAPQLLAVGDTPMPQHMDEPGYKIIHIQDIDFMSTCSTLVRCLTEIDTWSRSHPDHLPIFIQLELKDDPLPAPLDLTRVIDIDATQLDALDAEIRSVFDDDQLITPDLVRGDAASLDEAVTKNGWPTVGDSRGKVLFFLDNGGDIHDQYLSGAPNLEGRVAFTSAAEPGDADRAIVKLNDPTDASITATIDAGYIVRTRADADLIESWNNNTGPRDAALGSGAQIVSTDFPKAKQAPTGYVVTFGQAVEVRCNVELVRACPQGQIDG